MNDSAENKAYWDQEHERVSLCRCGSVTQKHDYQCRDCRLNPRCFCRRPIRLRRYHGQWLDLKCGKLGAA